MSTSSYTFPNMFTPQKIGLGVGLLASSFMFLGNVAVARLGVMHMLKKENRARYGIQPGQAIQLWEAWFDRAAMHFLPSIFLTTTAFSTAAYSRPSGLARSLLYTGAGLTFFAAPFTVFFIAPLNNRLKAILRKAESQSSTSGVDYPVLGAQQTEALEGLDKWRLLNSMRITIAGAGWVFAVLAILMQTAESGGV